MLQREWSQSTLATAEDAWTDMTQQAWQIAVMQKLVDERQSDQVFWGDTKS